MKRTTKRQGFTLVELLIVIVVIGILSAMMMLSSTEAVTSAKASNIVSNLRNLKTAALAMYIDSMDQFDNGTAKIKDSTASTSTGSTSTGSAVEVDINNVVKYMNGGQNFTDTNYSIEANDDGWFLKYEIKGTGTEKAQIKQKLAGRAKAVGLLKDKKNEATTTKDDNEKNVTTASTYDGAADDVYYFVR